MRCGRVRSLARWLLCWLPTKLPCRLARLCLAPRYGRRCLMTASQECNEFLHIDWQRADRSQILPRHRVHEAEFRSMQRHTRRP